VSGESKLGWYWHRLWAMNPVEILLRAQKKVYQVSDAKFGKDFRLTLEPNVAWPRIPPRNTAPVELLEALRAHSAEILRGEWRLFGYLPVHLGDPIRWQKDYLVGEDCATEKVAFNINHRSLRNAADIKVIWDLSRWFELVRLAMAGWLNHDKAAQEKCIEWLHDWCRTNPPFKGLNWTSGLEVGIRLVNYTWIDAFLTVGAVSHKTLHELRTQILPPHAWYAWRYKSFGSSANNHLIGELAGLAVALARWPELAKASAPLEEIGKFLERETLLQFAEDGGNNEQAIGYHLFSWEFCFQAVRALETAGISVSQQVNDRLQAAGRFYAAVKREDDTWDFGDCDNAWVTPLFLNERSEAREWHQWFTDSNASPALRFWHGDFESAEPAPKNQWRIFVHSGYAIFEGDEWWVRFDASPLGYLSMAAHGHLDALHVSVSFRGQPIIIDPGTGAYYADKTVRDYLAGWSAHNSPQPKLGHIFPRRFGTFLWGEHHDRPTLTQASALEVAGELELPYGKARRSISFLPHLNAFRIRDSFQHKTRPGPIVTRWKFAPGFTLANPFPNTFQVGSAKTVVRLQLAGGWRDARSYNPPPELRAFTSPTLVGLGNMPLSSVVSPGFRSIATAASLTLESLGETECELLMSPG
jgi:hypothetical protein